MQSCDGTGLWEGSKSLSLQKCSFYSIEHRSQSSIEFHRRPSSRVSLEKAQFVSISLALRPYQPDTSLRETQVKADLTWTKSLSKLSCPNVSVMWPNQLITISQNGNGYRITVIFSNISSKILYLLHITNSKWNNKFSFFSRWQNTSLLVVELT